MLTTPELLAGIEALARETAASIDGPDNELKRTIVRWSIEGHLGCELDAEGLAALDRGLASAR